MCVVEPGTDREDDDEEEEEKKKKKGRTAAVPSKMAIVNKIRWAIFERRIGRLYDEEENEEESEEESGGGSDGSGTVRNPSGEDGGEDVGNSSEVVAVDGDGKKIVLPLTAERVTEFARKQFPFFTCTRKCSDDDDDDNNDHGETEKCEGDSDRNIIYLENAGGCQVPLTVTNAMVDALSYRNRSTIGNKAKQDARSVLLTILGAHSGRRCGEKNKKQDESHLIFLGSNATTLLENLAQKYLESSFLRGDEEIVIATDNHLANVTPWINLASNTGAKIKWWLCTGQLSSFSSFNCDTETTSTDLSSLLTPQTRIVALSHCSNILGAINDVKRIAIEIKARCPHARIVVDGVALVPHAFADLEDSEIDWYVVSCHKLFGPHLGGLCGRSEAVEEISTFELVIIFLYGLILTPVNTPNINKTPT